MYILDSCTFTFPSSLTAVTGSVKCYPLNLLRHHYNLVFVKLVTIFIIYRESFLCAVVECIHCTDITVLSILSLEFPDSFLFDWVLLCMTVIAFLLGGVSILLHILS